MKSKINETNEKVFIENIPRLEWGKNTDNSFIRSCQLALNTLGEDYTYEFLMGISGAAFRLHFHPDWCPSSADATTGFDVSRVLFKSLGYKTELHKINDNNFDDIKDLYQKIIAQINMGIPIVAINLMSHTEWGIITGYLKNKPGILCRTYFDKTDEYTEAERAPWLSFFIGEKNKSQDEASLFKNSLEIAVQLAGTYKFEEYYSGFNAFDKWIVLLKVKPFKEHEVNLTIFNTLIDARQAAVRYLTLMKTKMKNGEQIINQYQKEVDLLKLARTNILPSFEDKAQNWTRDIVDQQIDILNQALQIEKEAIGLIKNEIW
jgi:hypothetical protein